jgi:hypothetical protein
VTFGRSQIEDHFSESMEIPRPPIAMINSQAKKQKTKRLRKKSVGANFFLQNLTREKFPNSCHVDFVFIIASGAWGGAGVMHKIGLLICERP